MRIIKINETDIFLDDQGEGRGKITISNSFGFNFSTYWGTMSESLEIFLTKINEEYFINRLCPRTHIYDPVSTMTCIRRELKQHLPWYRYPETQKELRQKLNDIQQSCDTEQEFVDSMQSLDNSIIFLDKETYNNSKIEFYSILKIITDEPWHYIQNTESTEYNFLSRIFRELKNQLTKEQNGRTNS